MECALCKKENLKFRYLFILARREDTWICSDCYARLAEIKDQLTKED